MSMLYDNFKKACAKKGTSVTTVIKALGRSSSFTGTLARGSYPGLDVTMEFADYLGITLDELVHGEEAQPVSTLSASDREWLEIISRIPMDKQSMCKDFLRTHAVLPEKYSDKRDA